MRGPTRTVVSESQVVAATARDELRREFLQLDPGARGSVARTLPFDPATVWRPAEVDARVACTDEGGEPVPPHGRLRLTIEVTAEDRGDMPYPEPPALGGTVVRRHRSHTQVAVRSHGSLARERDQPRTRCTLSEAYANELLLRIVGRFPVVEPPRKVSNR